MNNEFIAVVATFSLIVTAQNVLYSGTFVR